MAVILKVVTECRKCGQPFPAIPKSPGRLERLCFWCWLPESRTEEQ